jgi:hypothetical protein
MLPGPSTHPQTVREGPGYVTNVSGTRTGLDSQYDPALMGTRLWDRLQYRCLV